MADYYSEGESIVVDKVQLTDLENAGYLPRGRCIKGMLVGNDNWRSPEAHLKGELNKPTDVFSFGAVVRAPLTHSNLCYFYSTFTPWSVALSLAPTTTLIFTYPKAHSSK